MCYNRDIRPNPQATNRRRRQAVQRHQTRFCASKILAWSGSTTQRSCLEAIINGSLSLHSGGREGDINDGTGWITRTEVQTERYDEVDVYTTQRIGSEVVYSIWGRFRAEQHAIVY